MHIIISDLDLFRIPQYLINAFKLVTNVVVSITFGISSGFCQINGFVIIPSRSMQFWLGMKGIRYKSIIWVIIGQRMVFSGRWRTSCSSWFCIGSPPRMFLSLDLVLKYLNMMLLDSFMSNLYSQLRHSAGEIQTLRLIVLVVFGAVD